MDGRLVRSKKGVLKGRPGGETSLIEAKPLERGIGQVRLHSEMAVGRLQKSTVEDFFDAIEPERTQSYWTIREGDAPKRVGRARIVRRRVCR